jgi:glycosyltransferase involved in cell wall biosynthesis
MYTEGISVIICCYNSASRLPATLKNIASQQVSAEIRWEIIVVDNASTDRSTAVAKAQWEKYNLQGVDFQVVYEEKPGLSNAREKGVRASMFRYIIFCDDDNRLGENYLQTAYAAISRNPAIAALGGRSTAAADIPFPDWFETSKSNYAVGNQAPHSGDVSWRKHLWGSGIVIRKEVYDQAFAGFPSMLTGRNGQTLSSGEDSEMCMRFLLMGYRLHYLDTLTFEHFIAAERLCTDYNKKLMDGFIEAHRILNIYARFIDARDQPFKNKLFLAVKPFLRVLIARITGIKRWDVYNEKLEIFIVTGYKFKSIPTGINAVRGLSTHRATHQANGN